MQGKVCGKKRHTKTEIRSEISELICGRIAAGENYNLTRDNDIQDMDLTNALQGLMSLFTDIVSMVSADIIEMLKNKINNWMASQPLFIQALFDDSCWES